MQSGSKLLKLHRDRAAFWPWPIIACGMAVLFAYNIFRAVKYGEGLWAAGHDLKHYGTMARNFIRGLGFRVDAIHVMQLSDAKHSLNSYVFAVIHPLIIAGLMKLLGDSSYRPVFYTTAIYMTLILPLAYCYLRKMVSPFLATWGAFLLAFCPALLNLELLGLTESLMFVVLLTIFMLQRMKPPLMASFLSGLGLGVLHLSRATGMILAPGFFYLTWRTRRSWGVALFALGFLIPTSFGLWSSSRGEIKYAETYSPVKEIEHFGGPDLNIYMPVRPGTLQAMWTYRKFVLRKAFSYGKRMLREINNWWGDWWVFAPALLWLLWRKRSPWLGFFLLSYATSMASVLLFWYDYRVQIHLVGFHLFFALCYLKLLRHSLNRRTCLAAGIFFLVLAVVNRHLSEQTFVLLEAIIAAILLLPVLGRGWSRQWRPIAIATAAGFFLMIQWSQLKVNWTNFQEPPREGIRPYQWSLTHLREMGISQDSLILAQPQRDVTWFADNRSVFLPGNLKETLDFLSRFPEKKYVLLISPPSEALVSEFKKIGLKQFPSIETNLWIYGPALPTSPSSSTS